MSACSVMPSIWKPGLSRNLPIPPPVVLLDTAIIDRRIQAALLAEDAVAAAVFPEDGSIKDKSDIVL